MCENVRKGMEGMQSMEIQWKASKSSEKANKKPAEILIKLKAIPNFRL